MIKLTSGSHIVILNRLEDRYQIEADITLRILELQRYTNVVFPRFFVNSIPKPLEGPPKLFAEITVCFGCQTCWRMGDDDKIIDTGPHYISSRDMTRYMCELHEAPIVNLGTFCNTEAVAEHYANEYLLMREVLGA